MALNPYTHSSKEFLQPGARGEMFQNTGIPGHRTDDNRINRTNNELELGRHDVLSSKYGLDPRLKPLFRYGWAYGYNQLVIPKGRIVAVDPYLSVLDTDTLHFHNALTLANGGQNVVMDDVNKTWSVTEDTIEVDKKTGFVKCNEHLDKVYRPANTPIGIMERNEYTRDKDAYNGIMPAPIRTDAQVDLPWFSSKDKADKNPWGAIYGDIKPGDLLKADENGRVTVSPLSDPDTFFADNEADTLKKYEKERKQVIGQVLKTDRSLLPEGAARFAQWALEDRRKFQDFDPYTYPITGREGEDFVTNPPTAYQSSLEYPGYPFDRNIFSHDLHMLASTRKEYDPRFDEAMRLDRGIPGLTDGYNAVVKAYGSANGESDVTLAGEPQLPLPNVLNEQTNPHTQEVLVKLPETNLEKIKIKLGDDSIVVEKNTAAGQKVGTKYTLTYIDLHAGIIGITQTGNGTEQEVRVMLAYVKRGMAGIPTNLDWDGCIGKVTLLLQK